MRIEVPEELRDEDVAVELVRAYFADDPATRRARYAGAYFERLGGGGDRPEIAYQFTAEDLLAVSMLSVPIVRYYALHVLQYQACEFSALLTQIPLDITLLDDGADALIADDGPAATLWQQLHDIRPRPGDNRLGPVAAGKLLARKRPHLVPIWDSQVQAVLGRANVHGTWWEDLRRCLTDDKDLVREVESVRAKAGVIHLSLLRTFDIMCWMYGGDQSSARRRE